MAVTTEERNKELLLFIFQNAEMGQESLTKLLDVVEDTDFRRELEEQLKHYQIVFNTAQDKLREHHHDAKENGPMQKLMTSVGISMNTMIDKSVSHIAEMLIQGSNMGIIDITKQLKRHQDADEDIYNLGQQLLGMEQNHLENLKKYL